MNSIRAPKQWSLTKHESITSFEAWRQNLQYSLSLDPNFAPFLADTFTWQKKSSTAPNRGLTSDGNAVPEAHRRTAAQKNVHLELMLGQIANFCPVISRNTIVKNTTSVKSIWQAIRSHFGFQSTGAHFLDFSNIKLEVSLQHLAGKANLPSDFTSRNAPDCSEPTCQICTFVHEMEDSVVRSVSLQDILDKKSNLPFTTRSAWLQIQNDCPDLRRVHAHFKEDHQYSRCQAVSHLHLYCL